MHQRQAIRSCAGLAFLLTLGLVSLRAQETTPAKPGTPTVDRPGFDASHRVPRYFGQIGLTTEQRGTIYAIRSKNQEKIDALEKQIAEAKAQMLVECEGVLTDAQKQLLEQRRRASTRHQPQPQPSGTPAKVAG